MSFDAIGVAGAGLTAHRKWLDAISDNIANVNTATPAGQDMFREKYVTAAEGTVTPGVYVTGVRESTAEGRLVYEPEHPYADENGYVQYPNVDLGDQMSMLILAQRGYQANAAVIDRAKTSYEAALQIGRS
ncbi:flagellar basal-body rod protein FlgC [Microbacterium testaceum]|uniref:flagellar basal body rod protein FlgC n=1 Tax=Microbacterium TaxID=33882 RepID=UPI00278ADB91|nr:MULTISPECIES: flagellar basal body rod protein FlgC [Microbacterium]MDQ1113066.1 flagellar basal-body rod protein FlgC [Microbacterium testaceum]MDR6096395.1 flagellar basal-body rod protein FlgC [Microbacterium sp. SORGH_AS_0454]